ncbi:hypothetical protein C5746_40465 [Streptomyces atratus]|uniref:Recombinase zinc beta ribbon domain-containing protein n=2 Tax=Streptomyces atratus TaxID=1893 RepID=A0A2Z5JRV0_STRAR|nr:hypothetical protein C5746_40465 [Streptomyces atratus]
MEAKPPQTRRWPGAQLRALLAPTKTPGGERKRRARLLLSGLLRCSSCGGSMRVNKTGGQNPVARYACPGRSDGTGCARSTSIVAEWLEEHVERTFLATVGKLEVVEARETVREVAELARTLGEALQGGDGAEGGQWFVGGHSGGAFLGLFEEGGEVGGHGDGAGPCFGDVGVLGLVRSIMFGAR